MALATLSIDLVAKLASLQEGLDKAYRMNERTASQIDARWRSLSAGATALGAAIGGAFSAQAIVQFSRDTINAIDALNDAKDATGSTIENLSALEDVARRNGGTLDEVTGILIKFNGVLKEADGKNGVSKALQSIGLDVTELRKLDPAEALRQVAVALSGYADDGDKARIVQELFGKSVRDAAPFLKDLVEAGRLNATITTAQAEAAEKFNKQVAALQTNASNAARSVISDYLPALNAMADGFKKSYEQGTLLLDALKKLAGFSFDASLVGLAVGGKQSSEVERLQQQIAGLENVQQREPGNERNNRRLETLKQQLENLKEIQRFQSKTLGLSTAGPAGSDGKRSAGGGGGGGGRPAAAEPLGAIRDAKNQYLQDFLRSEKAAYGMDFSSPAIAYGPEIDPAELEKRNALLRDFQDLLGDLPVSQVQRLKDLQGELNRQYADGSISLEQYEQGTKRVQDSMKALEGKTIDVAARLEETLGDSVAMALKGNFDGIAEAWQNMLLDMVAQAAKADLLALLKGGSGGNLASLGSAFLNFLPGFASGGDHRGGFRIVGERGPELEFTGPSRIMNANDTRRALSRGGGQQVVINVAAGVGRAEVYEAVQLGLRAAQADARMLVRGQQ